MTSKQAKLLWLAVGFESRSHAEGNPEADEAGSQVLNFL